MACPLLFAEDLMPLLRALQRSVCRESKLISTVNNALLKDVITMFDSTSLRVQISCNVGRRHSRILTYCSTDERGLGRMWRSCCM